MRGPILKVWVPLACAGTIIFGTLYLVVQQNYRQNANDPQVELAEEGALAASRGIPAETLISGIPRKDISISLSPFVMFFDETGNVIAGSGFVGTSTAPVPPKGVLDHARTAGDHRVTWETSTGLRFATVIRHWKSPDKSGFILIARSLREVEEREASLQLFVTIGWIAYLIATCVAIGLIEYYYKRARMAQI